MTELTTRWRRRLGAAAILSCVVGISPSALAYHAAEGTVETTAAGGTLEFYETPDEPPLLSDAHTASTNGSDGNSSQAAFHASLLTGVVGTRTHAEHPAGLETWEAGARAAATADIDDELDFTIPAGWYEEDLYAVLHGDYEGYLGASGNYGTSVSQFIQVSFGYEFFTESLTDYGDQGYDGFYSGEIVIPVKLLTVPAEGRELTTPYVTSRQVSAHLYSSAIAPGYIEDSAEATGSDFADTLRILSIEVPAGVTWTSDSGVFLSVPEPSGSLLILVGITALGLLRLARSPKA